MDEHARHHRAADVARMIMALSAAVAAICFAVLVFWMTTAQQNTKLYEADNVVCASQPFALTCFERKPR